MQKSNFNVCQETMEYSILSFTNQSIQKHYSGLQKKIEMTAAIN